MSERIADHADITMKEGDAMNRIRSLLRAWKQRRCPHRFWYSGTGRAESLHGAGNECLLCGATWWTA